MKYLKWVKKKSCHLVPKVVIDLPFEGRKVEGSRKYGRRERVPKAGSRREETITEPIVEKMPKFAGRDWEDDFAVVIALL